VAPEPVSSDANAGRLSPGSTDTASLRISVQRYWDHGFSVIPLKPMSKQPDLPRWKEYERRRPRLEELERWFSSPCNLAVVCGEVSGSLMVLDFDDERAFAYCYPDEREILAKTLVVGTSRGRHVYLRAKSGGRTRKTTYRAKAGALVHLPVDVIGDGGYVVAPPSVHPSGAPYRALSEGRSIQETSEEKVHQFLHEKAEEWPFVEEVLKAWGGGAHHDLTLGLTAFLRKNRGFSDERVLDIVDKLLRIGGTGDARGHLRSCEDTLKKPIDTVASVRFLGEDLYQRLRALLPKKVEPRAARKAAPQGAQENARFESYLELSDGRILEEIVTAEGERFVVYDPDSDRAQIVEEVRADGETIRPILIDRDFREALTLPDGFEEYDSTAQLLREMEELAMSVYDPMSEAPILRVWIRLALVSWILDPLCGSLPGRYAPILQTTGPPESGKGRLLGVCQQLFYRPFYFLKTIRVPSLFRPIQPFPGATLILDEADLDESSESSDLIEFLNARAYGVPTPRYSSESETTKMFRSFGYTILAVRRAYADPGFNSRTISLKAEASTRPENVPLLPTREFAARAAVLRRKLLLWRLRHIPKIRSGVILLPESVKIEKAELAYRVRAAFLPMAALQSEDPGIFENASQLAQEIHRRNVVEKAQSLEGEVLNYVYSVIGDPNWRLIYDGHHKSTRLETEVQREIVPSRRGDGESESRIEPLTAKRLGDTIAGRPSARVVSQVWQGFGQGTLPCERYGKARFRTLLVVTDVSRLCANFRRYVVDAEDKRGEFERQKTLDIVEEIAASAPAEEGSS
jgi:hypothetical protein